MCGKDWSISNYSSFLTAFHFFKSNGWEGSWNFGRFYSTLLPMNTGRPIHMFGNEILNKNAEKSENIEFIGVFLILSMTVFYRMIWTQILNAFIFSRLTAIFAWFFLHIVNAIFAFKYFFDRQMSLSYAKVQDSEVHFTLSISILADQFGNFASNCFRNMGFKFVFLNAFEAFNKIRPRFTIFMKYHMMSAVS